MTLPIDDVEPALTVKVALVLMFNALPENVQLPEVVADPKVSPAMA
jgi:hypothetical protein